MLERMKIFSLESQNWTLLSLIWWWITYQWSSNIIIGSVSTCSDDDVRWVIYGVQHGAEHSHPRGEHRLWTHIVEPSTNSIIVTADITKTTNVDTPHIYLVIILDSCLSVSNSEAIGTLKWWGHNSKNAQLRRRKKQLMQHQPAFIFTPLKSTN